MNTFELLKHPLLPNQSYVLLREGFMDPPNRANAKQDDELRNLVFMSPRESPAKAKECLKKGGSEPPFVIGQRIIVL